MHTHDNNQARTSIWRLIFCSKKAWAIFLLSCSKKTPLVKDTSVLCMRVWTYDYGLGQNRLDMGICRDGHFVSEMNE